MIRKVFTTHEQVICLLLDEEWTGKSIELVAFFPTCAARKEMTILQLPQIPCYFDSDELHER